MNFSFFVLGFIVKVVASLDDTISRVPVIMAVTQTSKGKIAFSIGSLLAVFIAIIFAGLLSEVLSELAWYRYLTAGVIYLLAIFVFYEAITESRHQRAKKIAKQKDTSKLNDFQLILLGLI